MAIMIPPTPAANAKRASTGELITIEATNTTSRGKDYERAIIRHWVGGTGRILQSVEFHEVGHHLSQERFTILKPAQFFRFRNVSG